MRVGVRDTACGRLSFKIRDPKKGRHTRLLPAMAALTGEVLVGEVVSAFAGGLSA